MGTLIMLIINRSILYLIVADFEALLNSVLLWLEGTKTG